MENYQLIGKSPVHPNDKQAIDALRKISVASWKRAYGVIYHSRMRDEKTGKEYYAPSARLRFSEGFELSLSQLQRALQVLNSLPIDNEACGAPL